MSWTGRGKHTGAAMEIAALAALRTNVMIADAAMNITYMNPALTRFMQQAEADLKADLPRFDAAKLIGSNIDILTSLMRAFRQQCAQLGCSVRCGMTVRGRSWLRPTIPMMAFYK